MSDPAHVRQVPPDFKPAWTASVSPSGVTRLVYRATVAQHMEGRYAEVQLELGHVCREPEVTLGDHLAFVRRIWRTHEFVRLGLEQQYRGSTRQRHDGHPVSRPRISAELAAELERAP